MIQGLVITKLLNRKKTRNPRRKNQGTCNLVITRLPEVDVGYKVDIKIEENKLVTNFLEKLDLVNSVSIEILGRIGTKKDNTKRL